MNAPTKPKPALHWMIGFTLAEGQPNPVISSGYADKPAAIDFDGARIERVSFIACGETQEQLGETVCGMMSDDLDIDDSKADLKAEVADLKNDLKATRDQLKFAKQLRDDRGLAQLLTARGISYLDVLHVNSGLAEIMRLAELGVGGHYSQELDRLRRIGP